MTTTALRRSPLEGVAIAGVTPPDGASVLAEAGPFDAWSIGGRRLQDALAVAGITAPTGIAVVVGDLHAWRMAPDEVLLLRASGPEDAPGSADPPAQLAALREAGTLVTEV